MMLNVLIIGALALDLAPKSQFLTKQTPVVEHAKEAGAGYLPGSPLHAQQEAAPAAPWEGGAVPPVSTTMQCVMNLTVQYFFIYTAIIIVQSLKSFGILTGNAGKVLDETTKSVDFAPMLSILFLGTRMRALQLSQGEPDAHDLPQPFVKVGMQMCAWSILGQCLLTLVVAILTGKVPENEGADEKKEEAQSAQQWGQQAAQAVNNSSQQEKAVGSLLWIATIITYVGFTMVCYGAIMMPAPAELWTDGAPPVSPAVSCTLNLGMQYFAIYLAIKVIQTLCMFKILRDGDKTTVMLNQALTNGKDTVAFAPMLCILFIGARMRALQIDPVAGNPQAWAQNCFYMCTYAVLAQLILCFLPFALKGEIEKGEVEGDVTFVAENKTANIALSAIRYAVMLAMYGGFVAVIVSVFTIEAKDPADTPAVSPAMLCVMNLTCQYFFVYLALQILCTVKTFASGVVGESAIAAVKACVATVRFAPMLCVLFIGLRMRALQITQQKGSPQGWAQQGMFFATWAVLVQICLVLVGAALTGKPPAVEGNEKPAPGTNLYVRYAIDTIRTLGMLGVYGGATTCCIAVFLITPETANGQGGLIPGVVIEAPGAE